MLPGKDGHVRVVRVKTSHGIFLRPLQRIYPLEISGKDEILEIAAEKRENSDDGKDNREAFSLQATNITRSGREVKKPVRNA